MKIYGQSLREIFVQLPWTYKIVMAVGSFFLLFVVTYLPYQLLHKVVAPPPVPEALQIDGMQQQASAIFDPAVGFDPKTNMVWLAYTVEEAAQNNAKENLMRVRLAKTYAGKCDRWAQVEGGFEARSDDILAPDGQTVFRSGAWRVETPAIVYDPDDAGKEWKLYAYKYFWSKDPSGVLQVAQHYGMIVYKTSSDPVKGWSTEQWMFSPTADYPPPPYEQMILLQLNRLSPGLKDVVTYSRPSVIYKDGALVMTLSAFTGGAMPDRVIMIVSRDHGNSWLYAGTLLKTSDLAGIGPYTKLAGATLVEQQGKVYLAAVLGDDRQHGQGTFIFGFDDFARGTLQRDPKTGAPLVLRHQPLQHSQTGKMGGGFAAYIDACPQGLLTAEQSAGPQNFQIFKTYQQPAVQ